MHLWYSVSHWQDWSAQLLAGATAQHSPTEGLSPASPSSWRHLLTGALCEGQLPAALHASYAPMQECSGALQRVPSMYLPPHLPSGTANPELHLPARFAVDHPMCQKLLRQYANHVPFKHGAYKCIAIVKGQTLSVQARQQYNCPS